VAFAVGIDLGTTNTVVGAVRDGVVSPLSPPGGDSLLPSVVSFHPSGSVLVGHDAVERRMVDAANTVYSVKRLIGRPWATPEVQDARTKLPFELREGAKGSTAVTVRGESFSLPEISAFVLRQAKALAESALGHAVERAVITVPANFNDLQRAATKTAGRLAGLEVLRILNEPTAAALAYGMSALTRERVGVYDLGGGTFDVTLLDLAGNVFEVVATAGDSQLGGDDIDVLIAERMADDVLKKHRFDARASWQSR
jgi:molecular chaperone DnaK